MDKKVLEEYTNLWDEIKYHVKTINGSKSGEFEKDFMKIKFHSDGNLPLNKILKLRKLTIIVRSALKKMINTICKSFNRNFCMNYKC